MFYWLGFLAADGYLNPMSHEIALSQKYADRDRVIAFAESVGYDTRRVHKYTKYLYDFKSKTFDSYPQTVTSFASIHMYQTLEKLGMIELKKGNIGLLPIIKNLITAAALKSNLKMGTDNFAIGLLDTLEGRLALGFLRGFYDGDGEWKGGRHGMLYNSNYHLLIEIKEYYSSPNEVFERSHRADNYKLTIGADLIEAIFRVMNDVMQRKGYINDEGKLLP